MHASRTYTDLVTSLNTACTVTDTRLIDSTRTSTTTSKIKGTRAMAYSDLNQNGSAIESYFYDPLDPANFFLNTSEYKSSKCNLQQR
jgi:hypothetical protein